jgi:hypothetical protein
MHSTDTTSMIEGHVVYDETIAPRSPWSRIVRRGRTLRMIDVGGNQAVDTLIYSAEDPQERYSAQETITAQGNIFLVAGTRLMSTEGRPLMTITGDTCGRHDTVGGACSRESNTLRYGHHTFHQHACVENFLFALGNHGLGKRDMTGNINFFMNVPVEADGCLGIVDGISEPGKHVDLRAEMDAIVAISNCPQINNPCNGFNPTPIRLIIYE